MQKNILLLPSFSIIIFLVLYIYAASLYPGGSKADKQAIGFSWRHNYWCDLFDSSAQNGMMSNARPYAIVAMIILCAGFAYLFYLVPQLFDFQDTKLRWLQVTGILTAAIAVLIFTPLHGYVIHVAGLFGAIALSLTFYFLYQSNYHFLFYFGLICLTLCVVNFIIYDTGWGLYYLPVFQKFTFLIFFLWAIGLNVAILKTVRF